MMRQHSLAGIDEARALPVAVRALLEAEFAAGNVIVAIDHGFPAPPVGACFRMERAVQSMPGDGLVPRTFPNWDRTRGFSDEKGHFFVLGPPEEETPQPVPLPPPVPEAVRRFETSLAIDYEKWRDGVGYDLDAIAQASASERAAIEAILLGRDVNDWRDVEALAALDTPRALQALRDARNHADHETRLAIARYAPTLVEEDERVASLVLALETGEFYGGLSQALDEVETFHPPAVVEALWRGARHRGGEVAVHFAAMLTFLHGKADSAFDWEQRPFFLRFHAPPGPERDAVFDELCARLEVHHDQ